DAQFQLSAASALAQNAASVTPALTACEYSHCRRNASQLGTCTAQSSVTLLTGCVQIAKTIRLTSRSPAAHAASQRAVEPGLMMAIAVFAISAAGSSRPTIHQPR